MKHIKEYNHLINESITGKDESSIDRMKKKFPNGIDIPTTVISKGQENFKIGEDSIDTNSSKFSEIVRNINDLLQNTSGEVKVTVNGGASALGKGRYDNKALAERRRDKTIEVLKKYQFIDNSRIKFIKGTAEVGKEGSKNPNDDQYVKVDISGTGNMNVPVKGVEGDNTNLYRPELFRNNKKGGDFFNLDIKRICLQLPENYVEEFKGMIYKFARDKKIFHIPVSVSDVKNNKK